MDESRGVQGAAGPAMDRELDVGEPLELRVDPLVERFRGLPLAAARRGDERRHVARGGRWGSRDPGGLWLEHEKGLYSR